MPPGADIEVDGISAGVTPAAVRLKKGFTAQTVSLKKEGYEPKFIQPATTFNPVAVLNLFGIIGWAVDAATGAMMKYDPKVIDVKLTPSKEVKETVKAN